VIRATCHTVDDALTVEFDATPWFQEADPASILHVAGQGWSSRGSPMASKSAPAPSVCSLSRAPPLELGPTDAPDGGRFSDAVCNR
jgi:hypothetical protein